MPILTCSEAGATRNTAAIATAANNLDFMSRSPRPLLLQVHAPQSAFVAGAMIFCSPAHAHLFRFGAQQATGTPSRDERMAACCAIGIQARAKLLKGATLMTRSGRRPDRNPAMQRALT